MIPGFALFRPERAPRRAAAILLAVLLNLALVPCTMALEVVEEGHDCCPPKLGLEPSECCKLDDVSVDTRDGAIKLDPDRDAGAMLPASYVDVSGAALPHCHALDDPPDPPARSVALHKLVCVYLN
ncbi:MAG: hypothetical protein QNJ11_16750 [Woeseiaceae bacterium]|nr:hypothetical protein [Woeseiaceae bacterium]